MKFSLFALLPLVASVAAVPFTQSASLATRDEGPSSIENLITGLLVTVKQHTASMNQTVSTLSSTTSDADKKNAVASVNKDLTSITAAFHSANAQVAAAKQSTLGDVPSEVLGQLNGQPIILANLLLPVLQELNPALQSVLLTLSLGEVYVALQPLLTTELPTLVTGLATLVQGLLAALSPLLAGLGGILGPVLLGLGL